MNKLRCMPNDKLYIIAQFHGAPQIYECFVKEITILPNIIIYYANDDLGNQFCVSSEEFDEYVSFTLEGAKVKQASKNLTFTEN